MLLRLVPAVFAIYALHQPGAHGTQLVTEDSERRVKKIMEIYHIPVDLYPGITEYIDKRRKGVVLDINNILSSRKLSVPAVVSANDTSYIGSYTAQS